MSTSPSENDAEEAAEAVGEAPDPLAPYAAQVAELLAGEVSTDFGTLKVRVPAERWTESLTAARDNLGLTFFSWLSAIDWANEVEVGDPPSEKVEERYEILCEVSDVTEGHYIVISTDVGKDDPSIPSLTGVFPGADWHEREAAEMFGISFEGHPNPKRLYLIDDFEGHPLQKSFPLLTREVKPWPGKVDVEDMPTEENVEAGDAEPEESDA